MHLCFSERSAKKVQALLRCLYERGVRLWYDEGIPAGSGWLKNIESHMRGCSAVLFFLFETALASPNCYSEISAAVRTDKPVLLIPLEKTVPDFSTFTADTYYLEGVSGLTDLTCFEGLDPEYKYSFDLSGQDGLTDISTLYQLNGGHLCVCPEWREEAEALVAEGIFESYEVRYPDGSWQPNDSEFRLLSLDELETLPKTVLARVTSLSVAGDTVYNEEEYHVEEDWSNDPPVLYLCPNDPDNGERVPVEPGTRLTDLSVLKDLTGLRRLRLCLQPAETLNGLQYLETLEELSAEHCEALTDVSAAFTLQNLTSFSLRRDSGVTSLQGIQNLPMLTRLTLEDCQVADVSPLGEIDTSLDFLDIDGTDCRIWTAFLKDTPIRAMEICD